MAGIVPTFQKLALLLCKKQTTKGTAVGSLAPATDFTTVDDTFELTYVKEFAEQSLVQGIFGQPQRVGGMSNIDVKVSLPIIPTGTSTVPVIGKFLDCCGTLYALDANTKKHTWTFDHATAGWEDMELWSYSGDKTGGDSILTKAHSAMFDVELALEVGKPVVCTFTGKAVPVEVPAAGSYPTPDPTIITTVPPAVIKNAVVTINGIAFCMLKATVKAGNDVQLIKCGSDDSGYLQAMITGRKSTFTATVYQQDASAKNPFTGLAAGTLGTTSIKFGSGAADSSITIASAADKSEIIECKASNDNGLSTWDISGNFVDNAWSIVINDAV